MDDVLPAAPSAGSWPKVYRDSPTETAKAIALSPVGVGGILIPLVGWFTFSRDIGLLVFCLVAAALGIGGYLAFRPSITLICTPDDFTLVHRNAREVFYLQTQPWQAILNTRYEETKYHRQNATLLPDQHRRRRRSLFGWSRSVSWRTNIARTFSFDLRDGYGVTFTDNTNNLDGLIATIGERTKHLSHLWFPAQRYLGQVAEQGGQYDLVPRAVVEANQSVVS